MARSGRVFPRRSPMRAPLAALTRVPTSRLRSGAWHGRLAPSRRALLGLARRRALQRRGAGAEGERGPQQDPAAGGGGGAERGGGRAEGGREPASEQASEDSSARDSPLSAFILGPALLFPEFAAPPTSPVAAFNPCGLCRTRGRAGPGQRGGGGRRESLSRWHPAPSLPPPWPLHCWGEGPGRSVSQVLGPAPSSGKLPSSCLGLAGTQDSDPAGMEEGAGPGGDTAST